MIQFLRPENFERLRWQAEIAHCARDARYLAATYLRFKAKDAMGRDVGRPFLTYNRVQNWLYEIAQDQWKRKGYIRLINGKVRQVGVTTFWRSIAFHQVAFHENRNALFVAHDEPSSLAVFAEYDKTWLADLPPPLHPANRIRSTVKEDKYGIRQQPGKKDAMEFATVRTRSIANHALNANVGASQMTHMLHYTEAGRVTRTADTVWASLQPSLSAAKSAPGGGFLQDHSIGVIESTSRFGGEWFKTVAEQAMKGAFDEWEFVWIPWTMLDAYSAPVPANFELLPDEVALKRAHPHVTMENLAWRRAVKSTYVTNPLDFYQEYAMCLAGSTRVSTERGMVPIDEVAEDKETESGRLLAWWPRGEAETFTIRTKRGYSLTGTAQHRIARPDGSFVRLSAALGQDVQLRPPRFAARDFVATWNEIPGTETTLIITPEWARFLGIFMGDGSFAKARGSHTGATSQLTIAGDSRDADFIQETSALVERLFGVRCATEQRTPNGCAIRAAGAGMFAPLYHLGAIARQGPESRWKRRVCVPEAIWRSPKWIVAEFLKGLFEADGSQHRMWVVLFSKYRTFVEDVQRLLLGFGISCSLNDQTLLRGGKCYNGTWLRMTVLEAIKFNEEIGFLSARKRAGARTSVAPSVKGRRAIPIATTDVVVSLVRAGIEPVFDLTLPPPHTFSANGIVVHNSWEESWVLPRGTDRIFPPDVCDALRAKDDGRAIRPGLRFAVAPPTRDAPTGLLKMIGGELEVWALPEEGVFYDFGLDISGGASLGADWTVGEVVRRDTLEQVAEFRLHINPASAEFYDLVYWTGMAYNAAQINPDATAGWGFAILEELRRRGYPNIYVQRRWDATEDDLTERLGYVASSKSKPMLVTNAATMAYRAEVTIHSRVLLSPDPMSTEEGELETYLQIGTEAGGRGGIQWSAKPGCHDDAVSAWMLALISARDETGGMPEERGRISMDAPKPWEARPWAAMDIDGVYDEEERLGALARSGLGAWGER